MVVAAMEAAEEAPAEDRQSPQEAKAAAGRVAAATVVPENRPKRQAAKAAAALEALEMAAGWAAAAEEAKEDRQSPQEAKAAAALEMAAEEEQDNRPKRQAALEEAAGVEALAKVA